MLCSSNIQFVLLTKFQHSGISSHKLYRNISLTNAQVDMIVYKIRFHVDFIRAVFDLKMRQFQTFQIYRQMIDLGKNKKVQVKVQIQLERKIEDSRPE